MSVRHVHPTGEMKWKGAFGYVSETLAKEPLGLTPLKNDTWEVRDSFHRFGVFTDRALTILPAHGWHGATM